MKNKSLSILYLGAVLAICAVPSVGMLFGNQNTETNTENRKLSSFPVLRAEDGTWNKEWLQKAGDYFQEHFAFRSEMVTANAKLRSTLFGVSADDGVIDGTDGWLYYTDSLEDYLGNDLMGERGIFNVAHSMALMQEYLEKQGMQFLYVPVPNKNTLYGEHMPYYYQYKVSEEKNLEKLYLMLEKEGVNYLNLLETLSDAEIVLYHKTDSHWTNQGAALSGETILNALGKDAYSYENEPFEVKTDFSGDLEGMLFPTAQNPEDEIYFEKEHTYAYEGEVGSNFDPKITTTNGDAEGSLVMYRDSFGNALLPYIADAFDDAYFSRSVPYPMKGDLLVHNPDTVLVERAERFLHDTAKNPPVMEGLLRNPVMDSLHLVKELELVTDVNDIAGIGKISPETENLSSLVLTGTSLKLDGILTEEIEPNSRILVQVDDDAYYEAFPTTILLDGKEMEYGFRLYFAAEADAEKESPKTHTFRIYAGTEVQEEVVEPEVESTTEMEITDFELPQMEVKG